MSEIASIQELDPRGIRIPAQGRPLSEAHPTFARLGNSIHIEHLRLNRIRPDVFTTLKEAANSFPTKYKSKLSSKEGLSTHGVLPYHAVVITHPQETSESKEESQALEINASENYGFVLLSGALGTAAGIAHTAAEIFAKAKEQDRSISFSASISSSASFDTLGKKFPRNIIDRAAQQAVLIAELLQKHPCQNLVVIGHSLGGMELPFIVPFLEKLLEKHKLNTKIAGLVFVQAGGQFQQRIKVAKEVPIFMTLGLGLKELFPSPVDIFEKKQQLEYALEKGDMSQVVKLRRALKEMEEKRKNPPYLNEQQKGMLSSIDGAIEEVMRMPDKKEKEGLLRQLSKRRYEFLLPVIKELNSADARTFRGRSNIAQLLKFVPSVAEPLLPPKIQVLRPLPREIRVMIRDIPVAFIWGKGDVFFPPDQATVRMVIAGIDEQEKIRKGKIPLESEAARYNNLDEASKLIALSRIYPYASVVFNAQVADWPHEAIATNAPKFASIVMDIVWRMKDAQKTERRQQAPAEIQLYY